MTQTSICVSRQRPDQAAYSLLRERIITDFIPEGLFDESDNAQAIK